MIKFLKDWLKYECRVFICYFLPLTLTFLFGWLAVRYWEEYAWGSTATFFLVTVSVSMWLMTRRMK